MTTERETLGEFARFCCGDPECKNDCEREKPDEPRRYCTLGCMGPLHDRGCDLFGHARYTR